MYWLVVTADAAPRCYAQIMRLCSASRARGRNSSAEARLKPEAVGRGQPSLQREESGHLARHPQSSSRISSMNRGSKSRDHLDSIVGQAWLPARPVLRARWACRSLRWPCRCSDSMHRNGLRSCWLCLQPQARPTGYVRWHLGALTHA